MASQAEIIRANINANQAREIAATSFGEQNPEQIANGIPVNNDAALAASLKEMRDNSQEYAKLATEEARQQWEAITADNIRRTQSAAAEIQDKKNIETMNRTLVERQDALRAFAELEAVARTIDPTKDTPWNLDMNKLRDAAMVQEKVIKTLGVDPFAPAETKLQKVGPQDAGEVTQNQDGTWTVKYKTGEIFTGDAETVMRAQAAGHINTKLWARQQRDQAAAAQQPAAPAENLGQEFTPSGSLADDLAARQRESVARSFGFESADEMIQDYRTSKQVAAEAKLFIEQAKQDQALSKFFTQHPDFPGTDEANNVLGQIFDERGMQEITAENLEVAHALAVQRHLYEPISEEALAQANGQSTQRRPTAPPMLRTNNPEISNAAPDPYNMPLADLRRQAIAQELNGKGPGYR